MVGRRLCRPGRRWPDSQGSPCAASFGALATASIRPVAERGATGHDGEPSAPGPLLVQLGRASAASSGFLPERKEVGASPAQPKMPSARRKKAVAFCLAGGSPREGRKAPICPLSQGSLLDYSPLPPLVSGDAGNGGWQPPSHLRKGASRLHVIGGHHRLIDSPPTTSTFELQPLFRKGRQEGLNSLSALCLSNIKPPKHGPTKHKLRGRHYAASTGQTQWLQISLQKAESPTQSDINGFSTLHTAALYGRLDCMKMLIEKYHINVNLASLRGWRSIHLVLGRESKGMSLECLQYLLSKGADVNVQNQSGVSPLHKAASEGREDCLQVLIEAGGDVHAQDNEGQKPIDLCKMWGHRKCAKRLSHAMWQADKKRRLREMCRLEAIKLECQMKQREFIQKEQRDLDFYSSLAFEKWLAKKGLPLPSQYLLDISQIQRGSAMLRKVAREMASPILSSSSMIKGEPLESTMTVLWKYRQQKPWNLSTNLASEPATSIYRPDLVRLGVEPEKSPDHDFTSFLFLFRNTFGEPVIQIDNIGRVSPVPELSYEVLQNSLYPHTRATRLEVPKDLRPMHIFNLKHRRPLPPEHWWTDQMALSLRETLDPTFLGTLKTHFSTYCSAGAPSLSMVEAKGPPLSRAIRSSSSPAVCPTEQKGRDCPSTSKD
ncbi:ankyrin repeat domain-containing protein 53 [Candoia aspera]|uniref:ankyrin repeat domain-containing protein 53 n=1 Tax=Candoia aspera TaxID=51853 RepID=UPI002FD86EC1